MAKSTRSKVKRSFRSKKRQSGVYAATEAARLNRLSAKLVTLSTKDEDEDIAEEDGYVDEKDDENNVDPISSGAMEVDGAQQSSSERISTHGPRNSRREEWRKSKGLAPIPSRHGMNRQGGIAARRKAGRPSRRR